MRKIFHYPELCFSRIRQEKFQGNHGNLLAFFTVYTDMHSLWTATPHMKYLCVLGKEPLAKRSYAKSISICMAPSMQTDCNKASHLKGRHLTKIDSTKTCSNHPVALTFNFKQNGFHNLLGLSMHETFYKGQPSRACWQSWPMGRCVTKHSPVIG